MLLQHLHYASYSDLFCKSNERLRDGGLQSAELVTRGGHLFEGVSSRGRGRVVLCLGICGDVSARGRELIRRPLFPAEVPVDRARTLPVVPGADADEEEGEQNNGADDRSHHDERDLAGLVATAVPCAG